MQSETKEPKVAGHCGPCSPAMRNRYYRGKLLTVSDYQTEQRYMIQRRRLVNRAGLGWGILSGFDVVREGRELVIEPGIALDRHGRELVLCERYAARDIDDIILLAPGKCGLNSSNTPPEPGSYLLSVHYAECRIDGVRVDGGCDNVVCEPNHICETVAFSLRRADANCPPYRVHGCCDLSPQPGQAPAALPDRLPYVATTDGRGPAGMCRASCECPPRDEPRRDDDHKDQKTPGTGHRDCSAGACRDDFDLCQVPPLSSFDCCDIDFDAGVPLLYVEIGRGECGLEFGELTAIIGCCEPTRIQDIGWRNWHQTPALEISRSQFFAMFVTPDEIVQPRSDEKQDEDPPYRDNPVYPPIDTHFWVCFTGPVQIASLTPDVITMSLTRYGSNEAMLKSAQVPITRLWYAPTTPGDPPGTTRGFRPMVQYEFWRGEVNLDVRSGFKSPTFVEIRIDACAIVDWCGHAIKGCSVGRHLPTGSGCAGGDFVSSWRVRRGGAKLPAAGETSDTSSES